MSARLASLSGSISLINGTLISPCTLLFAFEAHEYLQRTLETLDTIKQAHRQLHRNETTGALRPLPDEVWDLIKGELRREKFAETQALALEPLRDCRWCVDEEELPDDGASWQTWLSWAMRSTEDWDVQQESGYACQICGEYAEQLQQKAVTTSYNALLRHYDLRSLRSYSHDPPSDTSYLALIPLPSPAPPRVHFDLLPNSRRPRPSTSLIQLDTLQMPAAPTGAQLGNYGRFFHDWSGVEVVQDPEHAARKLVWPPWLPRLTVWQEAEPEID
ncbi:hypothetical protein JCM11251_002038 [Rhodosporidiobolus azoricus]